MFESMLSPHLSPSEPLTVSDLTAHVKGLLESDDELADVRVSGEIGNISRPPSGHVYFTLKDAGSQVKCVMWKSAAIRMRYTPRSGDAVTVRGRIGVYERDGAYQLYVDSMAKSGTGDLFAEFERLKRALEMEGLFDAQRKRPLPEFPRVLGVVTSPSGAALQDILNVLARRCPMVEVILAPTLVQGAEAPEQIVRALQALYQLDACDVILVARGGGSLEELWAFNDERVVRAVAASPVPVVSGVGHETDFSLTDFAADVRAPTPSAAAELVTSDVTELRQGVDELGARVSQVMRSRIEAERAAVEAMRRAMRLASPMAQVVRARERLGDLQIRIDRHTLSRLDLLREQVHGLGGRLQAVSPLSTLARGYAIVRRGDGVLVRSVHDVHNGDNINIRVMDGEINAHI